jgi:hypothetical protein
MLEVAPRAESGPWAFRCRFRDGTPYSFPKCDRFVGVEVAPGDLCDAGVRGCGR